MTRFAITIYLLEIAKQRRVFMEMRLTGHCLKHFV